MSEQRRFTVPRLCGLVCLCLAVVGCDAGADPVLTRAPQTPQGSEPQACVWPPDWTGIHGLDRGGRQSEAVAKRYLRRLRQAGLDTAMVFAWDPQVVGWAARQCREEGMRVQLLLMFGHYRGDADDHILWRDGKDQEPPDPERAAVFHGGYEYDRETAQYAYCPGYRGPRYLRALATMRSYLRAAKPDSVMFDTEIWFAPDEVSSRLPGVIERCPVCRSRAGYLRNWQSLADEVLGVVQEEAPGAPVYLYGSWDWSNVPMTRRPATICWPAGTGSGPSPAFYSIARGRRSPGEELDRALAVVDVSGGYPWLTPYLEWRRPEDGTFTADQFRGFCRSLARAGAKGFSLWPGPRVVGDTSLDETCFELLEAGLQGLQEGRANR